MPIRTIKHPETGKIGFRVQYNYCSFPCCIKAIHSITDTGMREHREEMLKLMFTYYFDIDLGRKTIEAAPDLHDLEDRGGDMGTIDFRKKINKIIAKLVGQSRKLDPRCYMLDLCDQDGS